MSHQPIHRIVVTSRNPAEDPRGRELAEGLGTDSVAVADVYTVAGNLDEAQLKEVSAFFANPVIEQATVDQPAFSKADWVAEVGYRPGVTDNVGKTAKQTIEDLAGTEIEGV